MIKNVMSVESLTVADVASSPVWKYTNSDGKGELVVRAETKLPVKNLTGRLVGTQVRLANGMHTWALIGNVDANNPRLTEHFLTVSIERAGKWFALARYHDYDYADRGPDALSQFLGMPIDDIFPIVFDVRKYSLGNPAALTGSIGKAPREVLSRADIIAMAVP